MAELEYEIKRDCLNYAAKIRLLASEAPHHFAASEMRSLAKRIDIYYGFTEPEKKGAIRAFLYKSGGTSSLPELVERFKWHRDTLTRLVAELHSDGQIEYYDLPPASGTGAGRPARRIRLVSR